MKSFLTGFVGMLMVGFIALLIAFPAQSADSNLPIVLAKTVTIGDVQFIDVRIARDAVQFKRLVLQNRDTLGYKNPFFYYTNMEECFQTGYNWARNGYIPGTPFSRKSMPYCTDTERLFGAGPYS